MMDEYPDDIEDFDNYNQGTHDRNQTEIDIDSFLDEFFVAKMKIVTLEQENADLKMKVESLQRWKEQFEQMMMNDTMNIKSDETESRAQKAKRQRQKTDEQQCFYNFCSIHKGDADILARVTTNVETLGYTGFKRVPWSILKLELRSMYNNINENDKIKYLNKTRSEN
jgi:hypothetical protein